MDTKSLAATIRANAGITLNLATGEQPSDGWAVSLPGCEKRTEFLTERELQSYIDEHAAALSQPGTYLGAWFNGDEWYLDCSLVVPERDTALKLGARWGQQAVFDLTRKMAHLVPFYLTYEDNDVDAEIPTGALVN